MEDNYPRTGLRIRVMKDINPEVRTEFILLVKWLRIQMDFPIRVVVYLKPDYRIKNKFTKELVTATFFAPYTHEEEPYIRVATGDYDELLNDIGRDKALALLLHSLAHEIIHYKQWLKDPMCEFSEEEANLKADNLIDEYADIEEHF